MIASLNGPIARLEPDRVVVMAGGVGYLVHIPLSTFYVIEGKKEANLEIHTHVREEILALYGFATSREKLVFEKLITISGIGPKLAQSILSGIDVNELIDAVVSNDSKRLNAIPGVGKKTADRICLELKDKLDLPGLPAGRTPSSGAGRSSLAEDVVSALVNLGYKDTLSRKAVDAAAAELDSEPEFSELLRSSLRHLSG